MSITSSATLPLTTIFTPQADCISTITNAEALILGSSLSCVPSGAGISERDYAFSPALHCPLSYRTASFQTTTIGKANGGQVTETRAICCPVLDAIPALSGSSMVYNPDTSLRSWFATLGCTLPFNGYVTLTISTDGFLGTIVNNGGLNAYSVQIAWQTSDLPKQPATTTMPTISSTDNLPTTSSILPPSNTSIPSSVATDGLPLGTKVAVGVLVPLVVLALLGAGFLFARYRRRTRPHHVVELPHRQEGAMQNGPGLFIEDISKNYDPAS